MNTKCADNTFDTRDIQGKKDRWIWDLLITMVEIGCPLKFSMFETKICLKNNQRPPMHDKWYFNLPDHSLNHIKNLFLCRIGRPWCYNPVWRDYLYTFQVEKLQWFFFICLVRARELNVEIYGDPDTHSLTRQSDLVFYVLKCQCSMTFLYRFNSLANML